jgi:biotin operon repressor
MTKRLRRPTITARVNGSGKQILLSRTCSPASVMVTPVRIDQCSVSLIYDNRRHVSVEDCLSMRSDRLLSILLLLQTHQRVPAAELAERLEVSVRTIMRDVEALSSAGVPVYAERGRHGGICLLPGFRTDVTGLTADEARAMFVLVNDRSHAELGLGQAIGSALRKVMAALPEAHRDAADLISRRILIDPSRAHDSVVQVVKRYHLRDVRCRPSTLGERLGSPRKHRARHVVAPFLNRFLTHVPILRPLVDTVAGRMRFQSSSASFSTTAWSMNVSPSSDWICERR